MGIMVEIHYNCRLFKTLIKAAELLKRFISGIENDTNSGLEKAMDIAE